MDAEAALALDAGAELDRWIAENIVGNVSECSTEVHDAAICRAAIEAYRANPKLFGKQEAGK